MEILLSSITAGLLFGMVLAMVALGLTIIFGVMDIVNFAHGEFLMIGMYTGLLTAQATGIDPLFTLPVAAAVGFVLGIICYTGFVKFLLRGPMIAQLLGTFGLMLLLRNLALLIFGSEDRALHHGILVGKSFDIGMGVIIPATKLAAAGLSIVAFGGVWLLMNRTRIGKALTATSLNAQGARYMGIPTQRMNALAWGIGGGTVTIVVGMITELPGFWDFFTYTFNWDWMADVPMTSFKYMWVYLAYFLIMVLRPRGLFGWKQ
jgi:branched-chain amino acid transport system permease protein